MYKRQHTHSIKTIKKAICVKQLDHITRDESKRHSYRPNINYKENHNYNYNYNHNSEYYKWRTKKRSAIYVGHIQTAKECVRHDERGYVWPSPQMKNFLPYERAFYMVKVNNNNKRVRNRNWYMTDGYSTTKVQCIVPVNTRHCVT